MALILPMRNAELLRVHAFQLRGVTLTFPARSRSGRRGADGMIVFAMPAAAVRMDEWGCSCLLWLPARAVGKGAMDRALSLERLEHCRLAVRHGGAEGFLLYADDAMAQEPEALVLRVAKAGEEYWARWGTVARAELPRRRAAAASAFQ
jgi:hypothetical protein